MRTYFKTIIIFLILTLLLSMNACVSEPNNNSKDIQLSENTVTDASGNTLNTPIKGSDARIASVYGVSVPFIVALDLSNQVVAINTKSVFWNDNVPAFKKVDSVGRGSIDFEKLASLNPTVLIHRSNDSQTVKGAERLNIPVLTIRAENIDGIKSTLDLLGEYFGKQERANEVKAWMDERFSTIDNIVANIPENDRVSALCMGSTVTRIAGEDMLQTWMIEKAGGKSTVKDVKNNGDWADLGTESIFAMNPDVIFFTSSAVLEYDPSDFSTNPSWQGMNAVKTNKLYSIPAKIDSWDMPGIACVPGTFFMLHTMYPDYFSEEDLQKQVNDYYEFMFGKTFDRNYLGY